MENDIQTQVTQVLADGYNLLSRAELVGITGNQVLQVAKTIEAFQAVIQGLIEDKLVVMETTPETPALEQGDANEVA